MYLTDLKCRQSTAKKKVFKLSDNGGLYLEVRPTGNKYWRIKYRYLGTEKNYTIGQYPSVTLVKAREKRDSIKEMLLEGTDPSFVKQEQKRLAVFNEAQSFQLVAEQWHAKYYDTWTERYANHILLRLKSNVFPCFGNKQVSRVTVQDIIYCLERIEERKAYDLTQRVLRIIGQILRYAVVTGRAERDITPDLRGSLKKHRGGHYASITSEELPELLRAIYLNKARLFKQTIFAIKLLLLTFVRTSELIEAKWTEFDLDKKMWTIPASRMKTRIEHQVPLSKQVLEILAEIKQTFGEHEVYILPSVVRSNKPISNNTVLKALSSMGYEKKMTGHGFRSLAMSTIKENFDYRHEVIDRQLAHVPKNKIDKAYDRAYFLPQRTAMMQDWADFIDNQVNLK